MESDTSVVDTYPRCPVPTTPNYECDACLNRENVAREYIGDSVIGDFAPYLHEVAAPDFGGRAFQHG
ncbi:hypothetical protein GCM10009765_22370 [Fodinicola feengrottensis]|uniref:Uncharacterized protein n=1 Tax=Fodinicola feengrottensis TaxID=435914 RepID=A0ABN2GJY7_9ACTN